MTKLIVDSTCDLYDGMRHHPALQIVPMAIQLGDASYLEGIDIDIDGVLDFMARGVIPKTSQTSMPHLRAALEQCIQSGEDAIYLCFSRGMSGSYDSAERLFANLHSEYPDAPRLTLLDAEGGCAGLSLMAIQALHAIDQNRSHETIVSQLQAMIPHTKYGFSPQNLVWIKKSGRINSFAATLGDHLHIRPYLTLKSGVISLGAVLLGTNRLYKHMINDVLRQTEHAPAQLIAISYVDDRSHAEKVEEKLAALIPQAQFQIFRLNPVVASHVGPGTIAVFMMTKLPAGYTLKTTFAYEG